MFQIIKELLDMEKKLVFSKRAKGNFVVRPSSILWLIFGLLYLLAPIDIIPEGLIKPKVCGFIDDIILICFISYIVYLDIGGEIDGCKELYNVKVSKKKKSTRQNKLRSSDESICESNIISNTNTDINNCNSSKEDTTNIVHDDDASTSVNNLDDYGIGDIEESNESEILFEESSFKL